MWKEIREERFEVKVGAVVAVATTVTPVVVLLRKSVRRYILVTRMVCY